MQKPKLLNGLCDKNYIKRRYYMYIMASPSGRTLYVGVTSNLSRRVDEHKRKALPGFTARYDVTKLVYFEEFEYVRDALLREKQLKGGSRRKKEILIDSANPERNDLSRIVPFE